MELERVILDARAWRKRPSGIGTYTRALVERLPVALPRVEFLVLRHPQGPMPMSNAPNVSVSTMPGAAHGPATLLLRPWMRTRANDLYHALFPVIPLGLPVPVVITVHDLMWFHSPYLVSESSWSRRLEGMYHHVFVSHAYHHSARILANSHCTRNDIVTRWPDLASKIRVTPFAPSPVFTDGQVEPDPSRIVRFVPKGVQYFLVVGNGSKNKNHEVAVRAFARAFPSHEDVHLVVIQRSRIGLPRFRREVERSGMAQRIHLYGPIEDADVVALMSDALGFVFPSRYEGFGLPILEAMASGCPVLSSDSASLPEVAGNAALFYDPDDIDGFAEGMTRIVNDNELRQKLVELGRERAACFTWDRCVKGTVAAYREVVESIPGV